MIRKERQSSCLFVRFNYDQVPGRVLISWGHGRGAGVRSLQGLNVPTRAMPHGCRAARPGQLQAWAQVAWLSTSALCVGDTGAVCRGGRRDQVSARPHTLINTPPSPRGKQQGNCWARTKRLVLRQNMEPLNPPPPRPKSGQRSEPAWIPSSQIPVGVQGVHRRPVSCGCSWG